MATEQSTRLVFYDAHIHFFTLNHPNITAFIKRVLFTLTGKKWLKLVRPVCIAVIVAALLIACSIITSLCWHNPPWPSLASIVLFVMVTLSALAAAAVCLVLFYVAVNVLAINRFVRLIMNMLGFMGDPIGDQFLAVERDLLKLQPLAIGNHTYERVVLTPLMMDFGEKDAGTLRLPVHYPSDRKSIELQAIDLLRGIRYYFALANKRGPAQPPLLEIYPFTGVNPANYTWDHVAAVLTVPIPAAARAVFCAKFPGLLWDCPAPHLLVIKPPIAGPALAALLAMVSSGDLSTVRKLCAMAAPPALHHRLDTFLRRHFNTGPISRRKLAKALRTLAESTPVEDMDEVGQRVFAGIKVYPPLGFDAWPDDPVELAKAILLYTHACRFDIPLVTHCGGTGFDTLDDQRFDLLTSPARWSNALEHFPTLRVDFAHFGGPDRPDWRAIIIGYILATSKGTWKHPNVYTDIAFRGMADMNPSFYTQLVGWLSGITPPADRTHLSEHINFGSDFSMILLEEESHAGYVKRFLDARPDGITPDDWDVLRHKLACENPERFLFGDKAVVPPGPG